VPTVELRFTALPAHVRTARLVAVSLARRAGVADDLLDEVRLAVGEAATRAVSRHRTSCPAEPVLLRLTDTGDHFTAEVVDVARDPSPAAAPPALALATLAETAEQAHPDADLDESLPPGVDLAVIGGLVEDVQVAAGPGGCTVLMAWPTSAGR
jgi:anti-sigma regulatory factor (Ser/Thr protein kinase)